MKRLLFAGLFFCIASIANAQLDYTIPAGYEKTISKDQYRKLVDLSVQIIQKKFRVDHVKDGAVYLNEGQGLAQLNLHNIIKKIALLNDPSEWEVLVKGHFENMFKAMDADKAIDPDSFDAIKNNLTLRVYPVEYIAARGDTSTIVIKQDLEGTFTVLMLDLPGGFSVVGRESADKWKKTKQEIFGIAQANINKQTVKKARDTIDLKDIKLEVFYLEEETYAGCYALDLANNSPEFVGEWGTAIAIPNRQLALGCKISKDKPLDFVKFIQLTKKIVEQHYSQDPQPISYQFFWYYKGQFTPIKTIEAADGKISVLSPMGLTELMTKH